MDLKDKVGHKEMKMTQKPRKKNKKKKVAESLYLQQFNALRECDCVEAAPAVRGIDVALNGIVGLTAGLVQSAQVHPGSSVTVVQLNGTDIGLQCIHRLVLLLVENPEVRGDHSRRKARRRGGGEKR